MFGGFSTLNYTFRERINKIVGGNAYVSVNGATTYTSGGNTIFQFEGKSGSLTFSNVEGTIPLRILAVGGGGGGGAGLTNGGGGGGGGVFYRDSNMTESISARITVGDGGVGGAFGASSSSASNGGNTSLSFNYQKTQVNVLTYGGGAGGNSTSAGIAGGSAGGAGYSITVSTSGNTSASNFASAGGKWVSGTGSAGGGGAGTAGIDASSSIVARGGNGYASSITGSSLFWGGGGGGGIGSIRTPPVASGYDPSGVAIGETLQARTQVVYSPQTNKIYMFYSGQITATISVFDVLTNLISNVSVGISRNFTDPVFAPNNGKIYGFSSFFSEILIFNTIDNSFNTISATGFTTGGRGAYVDHNQTIVYIPTPDSFPGQIMVINTWNNVISYYGANFSLSAYSGGVYSPATKKVYGIPNGRRYVCTFDTLTNAIDLSAILHDGSGTGLWINGVLGPNGKIYCFASSALRMLVIDPIANTAIQAAGLNYRGISSGVVSPYDNKIYCPQDTATNPREIYIIDPSTNTYTTILAVPSSVYFRNSTVIASNSNIYFFPSATSTTPMRIMILKMNYTSSIIPTSGPAGNGGLGGGGGGGSDTTAFGSGGASALVSGETGGNTTIVPYYRGGRGGAGTGGGGGGGTIDYELLLYLANGTVSGTWLYSADYPLFETLTPFFSQRSMYFTAAANNNIALGDASTYALTTGTYEIWYKRGDTVDATRTAGVVVFLFGKRNAFALRLDTTTTQNRIFATHYPSGVETNVITTNITRTNAWNHVALTFNSGSTATLYVNGVSQGTGTMTVNNQNSALTIGDTTTQSSDIQFANARVWSVVRTAADISNNRFKIMHCGDASGLLFSCPLNDISVPNYSTFSGGYGGSGCSILSVPTINIREYNYYCCEFGGSNTRIQVPYLVSNLESPMIFTLEGCVKMSSGSGNIGLLSLSTSTFSLGFYMVNSALFFVWGNSVSINTNVNIVDNQWHHLCIKSDGINETAFVDGVQVGSATSTLIISTDANLSVGSITISSTTYYYTGKMYNVRLWNYVRTGFPDPFVPITKPTVGLLDSIPFNEIAGTTLAYDYATMTPVALSFSGTAYAWVLDSPSPSNLVVQSVSANSFRIAYSPLLSSSQYEITVKRSQTNAIVSQNTTSDVSATIVGVDTSAVLYNVYVAGISNNGSRTPESKTYNLSPIQGITVTDTTNTSISFRFTTNQYANRYQTYTVPTTTTQTINASSPVITGLDPNIVYTIYLVASNTITGARSPDAIVPDSRIRNGLYYYKLDSGDFTAGTGILNYTGTQLATTATFTTNFVFNQSSLITTSTFARGTGSLALSSANRDHLQLGAFNSIANLSGMSFSFWLKCGLDASNAVIFDFAANSSGANRISGALVAGKPRFTVVNGSGDASGVSAILQQSLLGDDTKWNHLIWNIDTSGSWTGYVNGLFIGSLTDASGLPVSVNRAVNYIGRRSTDLSGLETATLGIDEFRVWNSTVSPIEAVPLYYTMSANSLFDPSGLYIETTGETNAFLRFSHNPNAAYYEVRTYPETTRWNLVDASSLLIPGLTDDIYRVYVTGYSPLGRSNNMSVSLLRRLLLQISLTTDVSATIQYTSPGANRVVFYTYPATTTIQTTDLSSTTFDFSADPSILYTIYGYAVNTDNSGRSLISKIDFLPIPAYVNVKFISETSVQLEYPSVVGATSYEIYTLPATTLQSTTALSYLFTGLSAGTTYTFYVMAANVATGQRSLAKKASSISTFESTVYYYKMDTVDISNMLIANYKNTTGVGMDASGVGGDGAVFDASTQVFLFNTSVIPSGGITSAPFTYSLGVGAERYRNGVYDVSASSVDSTDVSSVLWGAFDSNDATYWKSISQNTVQSITPITGMNANMYVYPTDSLTYIASASSIFDNDTTYSAHRAFDGNSSTIWHAGRHLYFSSGAYAGSVSTTIQGVGNVFGEWCQMQFPYAFVMKGYGIAVRSTIPNSIAKVFYIVGSNNGTTWNVVKYVQRTETNAPSSTYTDTVQSVSAYSYYRIIITNIYINRLNTEMIYWDITGIKESYFSAGNYTGKNATVVFDGATNQTISGEWLQLQLPYSGKLVAYTVSAELAVVEAMPKTLYVAGSKDGSSWTAIDYMNIGGSPVSEIVKGVGSILHNGYYTYFRLIANATFGSGFVSFGKWDLYVDAQISPISESSFVNGNAALSLDNGVVGGVRNGNSRVQMPPFTISADTGMAVSYWMRTDISSGTVFDMADAAGGNTMSMRLTSGGIPTFYMYQGDSVVSKSLFSGFTDNSWNHFVWNLDASGRWTSYINGLYYDLSAVVYPTPSIRSRNFLGFDASSSLSTNLGIDDFRLWNKPINDKQVSLLYYGKTWLDGLDVSAVSVVSVSDTSAAIQYYSNVDASYYEIRTYPLISGVGRGVSNTSTSYVLTGFSNNGTRYNVYVSGIGSYGRSQMKMATIYEAVSGISVIDVSGTSANITYSSIAGVNNYIVKYTNSTLVEVSANVVGNSYAVSDFGVVPNTVKVVAAPGIGIGGFDASSVVRVSRPSTLSVSSVGDTFANISFSTVVDASYYQLELIPNALGTFTVYTSPFNITGLSYETIYSGLRIKSFQVAGTNIHSSAWNTSDVPISTFNGILRYYKFDAGDVSVNGVSLANYNTGVPAVYDASLASGLSVLPTINTTDFKRGNGSLQLVKTNQQYVSLPAFTGGANGFSVATWMKGGADASNACIVEYNRYINLFSLQFTQPTLPIVQYASASNIFTYPVATAECWVRTAGGNSGRCAILRNRVFSIYSKDNQLLVWEASGNIEFNTGISLTDDKWHHIALVYQNNIANGSKFYFDGVPVLTFRYASGTISGELFVGAGSTTGEAFLGFIDEVRIWNIARTDSDILNYYNIRVSLTATGLQGYWVFNEGTGTTSPNLVTSNPNTPMTLSSSALWNTSVPAIFSGLSLRLSSGSLTAYSNENQYTTEIRVNDNSWNHIGWSILSSGEWLLYVNGLPYSTGITEPVALGTNFIQNSIGRYITDASFANTSNILVDDFHDFDRALDLSYVYFLYNSTPFLSQNISPTNLSILDVSTSSITVGLTPNLAATTYSVRLATEVLPATTISNVSSNQIVVSGISPSPLSNMYTVFVYGANSAGLLSYPVSVSNIPYKYANTISYAGSMRVFVNGYTGPVVRVRRSTDNAESDFYSDATQSYLTTEPGGTGTAYATWIGTDTARVVIWYNQNGSSNHARNNETDNSRIPNLVSRNGKYVVSWQRNASATYLELDQEIIPNTIFSQFWNVSTAAVGAIACYADVAGVASYMMRFNGLSVNGSSNSSFDWFFSGGAPKLSYVNGVSDLSLRTYDSWKSFAVSVTAPVGGLGFKFIGRSGGNQGNSTTGFMTEFIFHNRVMSADNMIHFHNNRLITDPA